MSLLFRIDEEENIVLDKHCIKLCPGLKTLNEQQLLYIILVYDYHSKYHQFPLEERKKKAFAEAYNPKSKNPEDSDLVQKCIQEYKSLQYDSRREIVGTYNDKIAMLRERVLLEEDSTRLGKLMSSIKLLQENINSIQNEINTDFKLAKIKGGGELSLLEKLSDNMNKFKREVRRVEVKLAD